ncbi:MAG: ABC-type transport system permease component LolE [Candidatus Magasanikbacteria bacterium GW2011_GWA2_56_11]|uniref:ABC-type transport system permease component LolE n=1 Tax=Candidatus Magasanikbacteria bacterium GW2011_GWA2_56_11 TaxID=1619044 RepID=A0A0G2AL35_9BACT|nr:MAG: ABC-type transport system permease component LolE [Candidatus Magasanikbacteria bacterium GW2011_GWA2_56_11]
MSASEKIKEYKNALRVGWFLAYRQIRHAGKGTTSLIIFIMVLTFLNLVVVSGLLVGLIAGSFQQFREGYSGEVIITPAPGRSYVENSAPLISYLENHPGVSTVSPRHSTSAQILGTLSDLPEKNERPNRIGARLVGIDPGREEALTRFSRFVAYGENLRPDQEGYILIGANLLKKYSSFADANIPGLDLLKDVDVGSRVRLTITLTDGAVVRKDFTVKGVLKSKIDEVSARIFITDKELKRMLPINQEQFQEIAVRSDYARAPALVSELKEFMGSHAALIQTTDQAIPSFLRDIETTMGILGNALSSIALVVASITIFIVIFINAVTKRKFIGIMKGIGISPQAIQFSYVLQALFYGLSGSFLGLILTFGVLKPYFNAHPINFPFSDGILVATPDGAAVRVIILVVVTLFAGYIPAKLIVRRNTLDAILGR